MKRKRNQMAASKLRLQRLVINMMPNANLKSDTNIKLPLSFIVYALIAFVVSQIILFVNSSQLLAGQFRIPDIWMSAHFLLLGFAVMVAMGAMYQLVPVAFLTPIWNEKFGFVQFFVTALGVGLFAILLGVKPNMAIYGGIPAIIGVIMFIFQMTKTLVKQTNKNMMSYFVIAAIVCFFLTIAAGFILAWNLAYGGVISHNNILYSHISLGITGWFTLLIFGFSYKLVPMFSLSHGFSMKLAKPAFFTYIAGLVVVIISFWMDVQIVGMTGWLLLFIGFLFFTLDIKEILAKRIKKKLDKPFTFSLIAIVNGLVVHFLALLASIFGITNPTIWGWLIFLYIMSWIIFSILGYLYKIVPFLWWTHKYSERIGKENVPTLKEMIDEKLSVILFILFTIAVLGVVIGVILQSGVLVFLFLGLLAITSFVYAISIIRVLLK